MCDLCHGLQSKNGNVVVGIDVIEDAIAQAKEKCPLGEFYVTNVTNYFQQRTMKLKPHNRSIFASCNCCCRLWVDQTNEDKRWKQRFMHYLHRNLVGHSSFFPVPVSVIISMKITVDW
jgi:hypothetical protein